MRGGCAPAVLQSPHFYLTTWVTTPLQPERSLFLLHQLQSEEYTTPDNTAAPTMTSWKGVCAFWHAYAVADHLGAGTPASQLAHLSMAIQPLQVHQHCFVCLQLA